MINWTMMQILLPQRFFTAPIQKLYKIDTERSTEREITLAPSKTRSQHDVPIRPHE